MCGKGYEEGRVVEERVCGGGQARYAEPGGQGRETVVVPVGVVDEGGRGCYGAEVVP